MLLVHFKGKKKKLLKLQKNTETVSRKITTPERSMNFVSETASVLYFMNLSKDHVSNNLLGGDTRFFSKTKNILIQIRY